VRSLSLAAIKDIKIVNDHQAILHAIKTKDKAAGEAIITKHLTRYKIDNEQLRIEYPNYYKYN
jgi:DNA-binding FadR family transcriptional regulator